MFLSLLQYGRGRIQVAEQKKQAEEHAPVAVKNGSLPVGSSDGESTSGMHAIIKSSTVINKDDLVLVPNGNKEMKASLPRNRSYNTLRHEFSLTDCLDYINAGVEAIIEDEVTQRFIAEDLKVRNSIFKN